MAFIRICAHCGAQAKVETTTLVDLQPEHWYKLHTLNYRRQVHLCSLDCVIAHAETTRLGEQKETEDARA